MTKYTECILTRQFIAVTILRDVLFLFIKVFPDPMSLQPFLDKFKFGWDKRTEHILINAKSSIVLMSQGKQKVLLRVGGGV